MGLRVLLDPALAPALSRAGLSSARAILSLGDPERSSVVATIDLPVEGTAGRFHLKRYRYAGWRAARGLLGRGTLWGAAPEVREFRALAWLREHGVPAVRPVAAASETRRGRLVAHALLTEHVPDAPDLDRRLRTPEDPVRASPPVRRRVLRVLGRHLERMHAEGFVHRDPFARNVLVRLGDDDVRVWFLDCRRGGPSGWRWGRWHDLAALDLDLAGRVPATDRWRGLRAYVGEEEDAAGTARRILALERTLAARGERRRRTRDARDVPGRA